MKADDIIAKIIAHKTQLSAYGINRIGLFGSSIRGDMNPLSDIDVVLDFHRSQKTYKNFIHATDLLESTLNGKIDAVTPEAISPYIKSYIEKDITYVQISD